MGLSKWGLMVPVHDCLQVSSFCDENSLHKGPRMCTIADDCALRPLLKAPMWTSQGSYSARLHNNGEKNAPERRYFLWKPMLQFFEGVKRKSHFRLGKWGSQSAAKGVVLDALENPNLLRLGA